MVVVGGMGMGSYAGLHHYWLMLGEGHRRRRLVESTTQLPKPTTTTQVHPQSLPRLSLHTTSSPLAFMGNLSFPPKRERRSSNDQGGSQLELQSVKAQRGKERTAAVLWRGRAWTREVEGAQGGLERRGEGRHIPSVGAEGCRRRGQGLQAVKLAEVERRRGEGRRRGRGKREGDKTDERGRH